MVIFQLAFCCLLFYCAAIPLKIALFAQIAPRIHFGVGFFPFSGQKALRRARMRTYGAVKHLPWKRFGTDIERTSMPRILLPALRYLLRHTRLETFSLQGRLCTADAARTALICGCATALNESIAPFTSRLRLCLTADFSENESDLRFVGMISIRLGHIICAALLCAFNALKGRIIHGKASD